MAQHYDVAVVGTQTSGLIAAALLAKRGRRVLLVDHGESTTQYRRGGFRLPLVPTLVPTLDDSPPVRKVHEELGIGPDLRARGTVLEPAFQAVMPRSRIDVRDKPEALQAELALEFPELAPALQQFFSRLFALDNDITAFLAQTPPLPPNSLWERWQARKLIQSVAHLDQPFETHDLFQGIPAEHPVRDMLLGPLTFFGHIVPEAPSTLHAVRLIARYYRGAIAFGDRLATMRELLARAAETAGVDLRRGAVVRAVQVSGRRLSTFQLEEDRHEYSAEFVVNNVAGAFEELLPPGKPQARYALERQHVRPVGSLLVVNLVIKREVVPCGMAEALFVLNGRRVRRGDEPLDPPMFLRRYPATAADGSAKTGAEHEILSVAVPVRTADVAQSPERLKALREQVTSRVARVVPFLSEFLVDTSMPVDTAGWDAEHDAVRRKIDPWAMHPIYETTERPLLGIASRRSRGYFKNLVHCGRDVVPGLGIEGEYVAGIAAARTVSHLAGRRWQ